jgi:hypothetical protein
MLDLVDKWDANFIENGEGPSSAASSSAAAAATAAAAAAAASAASVPSSPGSTQTAVSASSLAAAAASAPSATAQEVLFKLLHAANYLNIRPLLQLACARVATLLRGRTPDQIRAVFNIRNDFTQAEEEEVRKEYKVSSRALMMLADAGCWDCLLEADAFALCVHFCSIGSDRMNSISTSSHTPSLHQNRSRSFISKTLVTTRLLFCF